MASIFQHISPFFLSIFLFLCTCLQGQVNNNAYRFEELPSNIGYYNTGVNHIHEDHRGFLWMATWSGIARYDGYSVKMYRQQSGANNGLNSNKINEIFEDSKGNLWVGTNYSGFYRYDRDQDYFLEHSRDPNDMNSLSNNNVWAIFEDQEGTFWIGTERGLNRFDPESKHYIHYFNDPSDSRSLSYDYIYALNQSPGGSLWVGTEVGLNRMVRFDSEEYFVRYDLAPEGISRELYLLHNFVYKIIPSKYDPEVLWICTSIGLKKLRFSEADTDFREIEHFAYDENDKTSLSHPFVPDILEEDSSQVWVATYKGLNLLDLKTGKNRHFISKKDDQHSLSNNVIMCLAKDRTGNLWIGMDKGVNKLNLKSNVFQSIQLGAHEYTSSNVICVEPSSGASGIWAGTRGGGIHYLLAKKDGKLSGESWQYQLNTPQYSDLAGFIFDILVDSDGWMWIATGGAGVIKIKEKDIPKGNSSLSNFYQYTKSDEISGDHVISLFESTHGDIWLGYWDEGLGRYDPDKKTFDQYLLTKDLKVNLQEFPPVHFEETIENGQDYLWLGTRGGGVYKLEFDREGNELVLVEWFKAEEGKVGGLSNNFINAFLIDTKDRFWMGTDSGLNLLDLQTDSIKSFSERDGLANGNIQSILEDDKGNIWVSSQQGISSLSFSEEGLRLKNYDVYDGLQDNFFNDEAGFCNGAGQLIFGGVNGLSLFDPNAIFPDTIPPKVAITDFRLSNHSVPIGALANGRTILSKSITETKELKLNHSDNVVSFEFTGLHFGEPKKLTYAYQLVGFDADWVITDASQRIAHYTNLPHEEFVFRVKASNGDGIWSEAAKLKLIISPPFWQSIWAFAIYALAAGLLIYSGIRVIRLRAEFKHSLELEQLEREKLKEVNKLKLQFFTNISHEMRTPLTLIISPLEQFLQNPKDRKMHQLFTRMHYNAHRLLLMINQLLDIRKNEAELMKLQVTEGDLVDFAKEITASFKNLARQRDIELVFSADSEKIIAWFDPGQLEKVLFNLLSNAFKFSKDGQKVEVGIRQTELIEIWVSDTGIGIPASQLDNIFELFFQVEKSEEWGRKGGTGIGLSLAKIIVDKHHGNIEVESEERKGTTFRILLKPGKEHFSLKEILSQKKTRRDFQGFTLPDPPEELQEAIPVLTGKPWNGNDGKPRILLVEDNPDVLAYLRDNLEDEFHVMETLDGQAGLEKALESPPDLIIADVAMPRMDGIEMCEKIKSNIETSHVPVILLTARTSLVFKVDGLETGADDYITKPFNMRLLKARIKNLINSRRILREHFSKSFDLSPSAVVLNSLDEQLLSQIKVVVEKHIDDSQFSVDQLASALLMSRMQLYRKLKSLTGKSPNQIIRSFRLKRAAQLLQSGQFNVSDVTYMVGYNDLKSFREQFKKEFGVNPSGYLG